MLSPSERLTNNSQLFNCLVNDKNLDLPKLKAFTDDKINVPQKLKFASRRIENIAGREENAGYSIFSHSLNVF